MVAEEKEKEKGEGDLKKWKKLVEEAVSFRIRTLRKARNMLPAVARMYARLRARELVPALIRKFAEERGIKRTTVPRQQLQRKRPGRTGRGGIEEGDQNYPLCLKGEGGAEDVAGSTSERGTPCEAAVEGIVKLFNKAKSQERSNETSSSHYQ